MDANNPDETYWTAWASSKDGKTFTIDAVSDGKKRKGTISPEYKKYLERFGEKN
jgi:hypothetical protein